MLQQHTHSAEQKAGLQEPSTQMQLLHNKKRKRPAATAAKATAGEQRQTAALRRQKLKFGWAETLGTDTAGVINSEISAEQQQSTIGRTTMADDQKPCPGATSSSMTRQKTPRTIMAARSAESQQ